MISQYIIFIHIRIFIYIYIYNICIHIISTLFIVDIDIPEITNMTFSAFGLTLTNEVQGDARRWFLEGRKDFQYANMRDAFGWTYLWME